MQDIVCSNCFFLTDEVNEKTGMCYNCMRAYRQGYNNAVKLNSPKIIRSRVRKYLTEEEKEELGKLYKATGRKVNEPLIQLLGFMIRDGATIEELSKACGITRTSFHARLVRWGELKSTCSNLSYKPITKKRKPMSKLSKQWDFLWKESNRNVIPQPDWFNELLATGEIEMWEFAQKILNNKTTNRKNK